MKENIHKKICQSQTQLKNWYNDKTSGVYLPFYSSFDIRDSSFKIGVVDGNIFPAGFNNICQMDKEHASQVSTNFIKKNFPHVKRILIVTEDHFRNAFYWENVFSIVSFLEEGGFDICVGMLTPELTEAMEMESYKGNRVLVKPVMSLEGQLQVKDFLPDLVISNNDFSFSYPEIDFSKTALVPARELGWYQRKKSGFFENYNGYAKELAEQLDIDPGYFSVETRLFENFQIAEEGSKSDLAQQAEMLLDKLRADYRRQKIDRDPFLIIKNNAGTYGLAVTKVSSGDEVMSWNNKVRKKMKATKGGGGVSELILQEGIPSVVRADNAVAEPAIYMVGQELVGGFLRTHTKKDESESLNSPGAVYKKLCLSDLKFKMGDCVQENVYGWVAKMGLLAISQEAKELGLRWP